METVVVSVECAHFEFSPDGQPCIIMELEATFNLTKLEPTYEVKSSTFVP